MGKNTLLYLHQPKHVYQQMSCKIFLKIFSKFLFNIFKNRDFMFYFAAAAVVRVHSILKEGYAAFGNKNLFKDHHC